MDEHFNLTDQQKNIWDTEMFFSGTNVNNIGGYIYFSEKVNFSLLEKTANTYVQHTDSIRLRFNQTEDAAQQRVFEFENFDVDLIEVKSIDEANKLSDSLVKEPFNIYDSNLFKFVMFKLPNGTGGLIGIFHHLICDAWSMGLVISRLVDIYSSLSKNNSVFSDYPSYTKFIDDSILYDESDKFKKDKAYWDSVFDMEPELTYIYNDKANQSLNSKNFNGSREICEIDGDVFPDIIDFCKTNNISTYTFFMGIFCLYLSKINNTSSAIIGTPVLNRANYKEKQIAGMFVSNVPFKVNIDFKTRFLEFIKSVAVNQSSIFRHQKYPYLKLLTDVKAKYGMSDNLYDFVLSYQNTRDNKNESDVQYTSKWITNPSVANSVEVHFYDMDDSGKIHIYYNYQTNKFSKQDILNLHSRIIEMAKFVISNPVLETIPVLCANDRDVISKFNSTNYEYAKDETVVDLFEKQVRKNREQPAVIFKGQQLTYGELDSESNKLSNMLLANGIKQKDVVGIMLNRSYDLHIAMWGVLKSGASYLLIDPSLPEDRISYMLDNANVPFVITDLFVNHPSLSINDRGLFDDSLPSVNTPNSNRFCVIYTSGSTGIPKGVELRRISVINLVNSFKKILNTSSCDMYLSTSTVAFDMFMVENFLSILSGKTVVLADEDEQKIPSFTSKLIRDNNIDFIVSTPSKIGLLLEESDCLKDVKVIQLGGEVLKPSLYKALKESTNAAIHNGYGPSECCACSSNKLITSEYDITIGTPYLNVKMYIENSLGNVLPVGVPGEIVIEGDGVGLGYINKKKFNGVYRTGDLALLSSNGDLVYFGRKDNQIKLHGLRIELDEITSKLLKLCSIINAVSVIKKVNDIDCICSYVTSSDSSLTEASVKKVLSKVLPNYMVPSHIVFMDKFPITLNGKIDTRALPDILFVEAEYVAPESDLEKNISKIWCNFFNKKKISTVANFFDLGGDSLCCIRLVSELYSRYGIKIEIKDIFEKPTISELANYISSENLENSGLKISKIKKHDIHEFYPVSPSQRGIYYTFNMNKNSLTYNTPFKILFDKVPDASKLENAINTIINSHEAFRTYFVLNNNDVVQKVRDKINFKLKVIDHENTNFIMPFDLGVAPLIHAELNVFDGKALLQFDIHHIICDGASIGVFAKELCDLYNGKNIKPSDIDYIDYSLLEYDDSADKEYWLNQFASGVPLLNMPTEFVRSSEKICTGDNLFRSFTDISRVYDFCKKFSITPYMFLLSAYYILLYKYTMQNDIVIGTPVAGRNNPQFQNVIGMFVNTLALKQNIQSTYSFSDFINLVKSNCMNAFAHQLYPLEDLVSSLDIVRDPSRSPLYDVMFVYESEGLPSVDLNGLKSTCLFQDNHTSKFDFTMEITPSDDSFNIRLEYCTALYSRDFMDEFLNGYFNIINSVLNDNSMQISKIQTVTNAPDVCTTLDYPKELRIIDLFEKQVLDTPDSIALIFGNEAYTYKELNDKVNKLANHIRNNRCFKNDNSPNGRIVGIVMNRRAELIISMLAILKAGSAYLPIDPTYPKDRVKYIFDDSKVKMVLTEKCLVENVASISGNSVETILVDDISSFEDYSPFDSNHTSSDLAYIIYTSGSTGNPKGVMLKQSSVVNFIYGICNIIPLKGESIVSITTMCFDIFVLESLLPLCSGMKVVLASNEEQNNPILLNILCEKNNVSAIQTTPSKYKFLISDESSLDFIKNMKCIMVGGEPFPADLLTSLKSITQARLFNMYGPTETTVWSSVKELTNCDEITIGSPIANTSLLVLDNDMNPVPYNVPGTLYIGGDGVSLGYMNRPELTSQKFVEYNNMLIYNSGDLAKILPNNELACLGRSDFQVKIRGLRIELGEIENAIVSYPDVVTSVVTVKNVNGRDMLCGYFVAEGRVSLSLLKNALSKKLPHYMVPTYMVQLDSFSYTPNGKIDRKQLPVPQFKEKEIISPNNSSEKVILDIWKSILSLDTISVEDDFFEIGGDSLCALKLQLELMKLGYNINYGDIFKNNTIRSLSKFLQDSNKDSNIPTYTKNDFHSINKLLKKSSRFKKVKFRSRQLKNTLLIGATGFLGIHVLAELLKDDAIKIYCLIREDPSTSPENKLKNKFKYYFGSDLSYLFGTRLFVINGDITNDNFGISTEQYEFLGNEVYSVINCAALVKHYGAYSDFEKINVLGVQNIIKFCEKYDKEFIQTSTTSVSGNTMTNLPSSYNPKKKVYFGENKLFVNQSLDNVYVRSKFEAEKIILEELANKKLRGIILRIGNITNRFSDGKFQENSSENAFLNRFKAFMNLGFFPESMLNNYIEFSPVDKISEAVILCMKYYSSDNSILHLYNSKHLYISELYNILKELNISFEPVSDSEFKEKLMALLYDRNNSDKVSVLLNDLDRNNNLMYKTNLVISNKFTTKFLNKAGFDWPVIDKDYINKIINTL